MGPEQLKPWNRVGDTLLFCASVVPRVARGDGPV